MSKIIVLHQYLAQELTEKIVETAELNSEYVPGLVQHSTDPNNREFNEHRICQICSINLVVNSWISGFLMHIANSTNLDFGYSLSYPKEASITKYNIGGHYNWHHDVDWRNHPSQRKLSISVQLSDSSDYEGGDIQFDEIPFKEDKLIRDKGTVIVFPSYIRHRVTPVTRGERKALVSWIEGPAWR